MCIDCNWNNDNMEWKEVELKYGFHNWKSGEKIKVAYYSDRDVYVIPATGSFELPKEHIK